MKTKLAVVASFLSLVAVAQQQEKELDAVTVTASLEPKPVSRTGRNILTFRGDEFNNLPIHSVDELLRFLPGMEVQFRGPMGSQSDIVLRGGTFQQVLVLLDGVRINDPNTGHFNSYIPVTPAEIDRVEVLKGASSAIYGAEAVGGVVHIITKTFTARRTNKLEVTGSVTAGEYDLLNVNAGAFYQNNKMALGGGVISNNTSGRLQRGTSGSAHNTTATASASRYLGNRWQLSVRAGYDTRDFAAQNFYTPFASDTAAEQVRTAWGQTQLQYNGNKHRVVIDAGYKHVTDEYAFNKISIANKNTSELWQLTARDEWKLNTDVAFISGVQILNKGIRSNDRGHHRVSQGGLFMLLNYSPGEHFSALPAMRFEYNERSGLEWIPQINLSYKWNKFQWRASAGKTIRDADFTERFNNYNKPTVASGGRIGDPDLEAERSFSYEAGGDFFPVKSLRISATAFRREHRRLIDYVSTPYADMPRQDNLVAGGTYALARNISRVNTTGAELDIQYSAQFTKGQSAYAGAGLVWLESKSGESQPSFYIASHARVLVNWFGEWRSRRIVVGVTGLYKRRSPQAAAAINASLAKSYTVVQARAGWLCWQQRLQLFVRVDNVFDTEYSDLLGAPMPGRWTSGGISFRMVK